MKIKEFSFGKRVLIINPTEFHLIKLALPLLRDHYDLQGLLESTLHPMMDKMGKYSRNGIIEIKPDNEGIISS